MDAKAMVAANLKLGGGGLLGGDEPRRRTRGGLVKAPNGRTARMLGGGGGGGAGVMIANAREVLTCGVVAVEMVATTDPFDRAHQQRDSIGHGLLPACRVLGRRGGRLLVGQPLPGSRPRLYPRALMVSGPDGPVSIDSAFDQAYERAVRLAAEVGDVAGAGVYTHGGQRQMAARAAGVRALERRIGPAEASRLVRGTRSVW